MKKQERYREVFERFSREMPAPKTELHYSDAFQLLVAVILSAQCTDKRVNTYTPALFAAYPTAESMSQASVDEIFAYIKSISYPNNKAKALVAMSRMLLEEFGGQVPDDIDNLMRLPGVGRKTANVILSVVYSQPKMAVDTHVFRVSERIGLTTGSRTPRQTEETLTSNIEESLIARAHHWLILHGRYICKARRPLCDECFLTDVCRYHQKELKTSERIRKEALAAASAITTKKQDKE